MRRSHSHPFSANTPNGGNMIARIILQISLQVKGISQLQWKINLILVSKLTILNAIHFYKSMVNKSIKYIITLNKRIRDKFSVDKTLN
jgi:hypothetical protein